MLEQMEAGITNLQAKYKEMLDPTKGEGRIMVFSLCSERVNFNV